MSARIDLTPATEQPGTSSCDCYDLLRAAAGGEFIGLPAALRGWLDLPEKTIATLLVPVSAFCDTSWQAAPATLDERKTPAVTGRTPRSI